MCYDYLDTDISQAFRLLVRNCSLYDASADISVSGQSLGKWLVAREPKLWHNVVCDSIFKFQESYGMRLASCLHPAIEMHQTASPRCLSQPRLRFDFSTLLKFRENLVIKVVLCLSFHVNRHQRMGQAMFRTYPCFVSYFPSLSALI